MSVSREIADLERMVEVETQRRQIITSFITNHMKDGTDFGRIHISRNCTNKWECTYEINPSHFSKPSLFKPGGEKFCSLMKLRPTYKKDIETWEMAGSKPGLFCFLCQLIDSKGNVQGEGRGACSVAEKGNENTAIKIGTKRAKIDAVLSSGGLSDFFTQDLEDMDLDKSVEPQAYATRNADTQRRTSPSMRHETPMTEVQKNNILEAIAARDKSIDDLNVYTQKAFNKKFDDLSLTEANQTLNKVKSTPVSESTQTYKTNDKTFEGGSTCTFILPNKVMCKLAIKKSVMEYSRKEYGRDLCFVHQKQSKKLSELYPDEVIEHGNETVDAEEADRGIEQMRMEKGDESSG